MATTRSERIRPLIFLGIFLFAWLILPVFFKSILHKGFREFQAPLWVLSSHVSDVQEYWALRTTSKHELIASNIEMARQLAAQKLQLEERTLLKQDLQRLEELLDIPALQDYQYVVSRVVRRRQNSWWQQMVIRKGSLHGIRVNDPVICAQGLVGKVSKVDLYTATVEMVTNPGFRFSAALIDDSRPLEYLGVINAFPGKPMGEIRFIPPDILPEQDVSRLVITSGLGGIFPRGLPVGEIVEMEMGGEGLYQRGKIRLPAYLNSLQEVAVLVPVSRNNAQTSP